MICNFRRVCAATAAFSLAATLAATAAAAAPASLYSLVFEAPHFAKVSDGQTVSYHFVRKADDPKLDPSFEDEVKVLVGPEGAQNSIKVDLFTGERAQSFTNLSKVGNAVIVTLLEQDVKEMNKTLKGSPFYFRNRLRQALSDEKPVESTKLEIDGKTVDGWKIVLKPFENDADNRPRLREYAGRTYELTFTEAVPGGLYALKTVTPKADGGSLLTEELTFKQGQSK